MKEIKKISTRIVCQNKWLTQHDKAFDLEEAGLVTHRIPIREFEPPCTPANLIV